MDTKTMRTGTAIIGAVAATLLASSAQAALVISTDTTSNVICDTGVCTATAPDAVLNVTDLANLIASAPVTIQSGSEAQDIVFNAPFSWTNSNGLTLDSYRSITVQKSVSDSGPASLTLTTNDGGQKGELGFGKKGRLSFLSASNSLIINGNSYTLVNNIKDLASDVAVNPGAFYALIKDYDATTDGIYPDSPVGTLSGAFEGLGHEISNLTIYEIGNCCNIGFFSQIAPTGTISNLQLEKINITVKGLKHQHSVANIGILTGANAGTIARVNVSGTVVGGAGFSRKGKTYYESVGALAGVNNGNVRGVAISASIIAGAFSLTGGVAGSDQIKSTISRASAAGSISLIKGNLTTAGGLVASFVGGGSIDHSDADFVIKSDDGLIGDVGGLVGFLDGNISYSHARGTVETSGGAGGLVGINLGHITNSYASGDVTVGNGGGLVGFNTGFIEKSFAFGAVVAGDYARAGSLVGENAVSDGSPGRISDCYALGATQSGIGLGQDSNTGTGGLVGANFQGVISRSYSIGAPSASTGEYVGGLLGYDNSPFGKFANDYWDMDTSGINDPSQGVGNVAKDPGITGLTDTQLKSGLPVGFSPKIWAENPNINNGYPYLISNPPPK